MKRSTKLRLAASTMAVGAVAATAAPAVAGGNSSSQPVTVTASLGTRTLNVLSLAGGQLQGLTLGIGHTGAFLANVTDVGYQNVGYQVTAELSNLYPYDAKNKTYDFNGTPVPSSAVSLGFPAKNPLDLTNVASNVAPVIALTGNLSSVVSGLLGGLGGSLSSITTTLNTTVTGASTPVANLATDIINGTLSDLPVQLNTGSGGTFTQPGPMTGVNGAPAGSATPSQVVIEQGTPNTVTGLLSDLESQLSATNGVVPLQTLINNGILSQSDVLSAIQSATGIPLNILQTNATAILGQVTATINNIGSVLGQSGSYNALPLLNVNLPKDTASGTYQGILTVNLMDVPSS